MNREARRSVEIVVVIAAGLFIGERFWNHFWSSAGYCLVGWCVADALWWFENWQERQRAKDKAAQK
jgi:hypothetical protein